MTSLSCPLANCVSEGGIELTILRVLLPVMETFGAVLIVESVPGPQLKARHKAFMKSKVTSS